MDSCIFYEEICQLCDDDREGVSAVASAIDRDERLREIILRNANSIQNVLARPAHTVGHAILILGISRVRTLVANELEHLRRLAASKSHRLDPRHAALEPHSVSITPPANV